MPRPKPHNVLTAAGLLLFAALAGNCGTPATGLPATLTVPPAASTGTAASTPPPSVDTATVAPTALPTTAPPPLVPKTPLSAGGPWLLLTAPDGYWALNPDGSGLTHLMAPPPYFRPGPVAPGGGHAAFVGSDDAAGERGLKLYTLSLPEGQVELVTMLTGPTTEPGPDAQPGDAAAQLLFAVGQSAWSPDGQRLAFIGLQDGPSADLYVYALADGSLSRLSDGPSQPYQPSWSPDGQFVVQMGADSFGAGDAMAGVWATRTDNTEVRPLYTPDSGDEQLLGWLAPDRFAVASFRAQCAMGDLRVFNLSTGAFTPLFPSFYQAAALDPVQGRALVAVDGSVANCQGGVPAGLYLATQEREPRLLIPGEARGASWSPEAGLFFGRLEDEVLAFSGSGEPVSVPAGLSAFPLVAPGGQSWAWTGPDSGDLWVSVNGAPARRVYSGFVFRAAWSPDGRTLLFDGDGVFQAAYAPDFMPARIAAGLLDSGYDTVMTWAAR